MAPSTQIGTGRPSHRSILELDKSNEPFPTQIAEICDILGIQLSKADLLSEDLGKLDVQRHGPREEWALRWLLKNLQCSDLQPSSLCLDFNAWLLLRELILRTPLSNTARLLNAHKFTATLQKSIEWMREQVGQKTHCSHSLTSEDQVTNTDSSSATVEASSSEGSTKSRKRKRDGSLKSTVEIGLEVENVELLYTSIYAVVNRLEILTRDPPEVLQDVNIEHLKSALRILPEQAAKILGSSIEIASFLIGSQGRNIGIRDSASFLDLENRSQYEGNIASVHIACISSVVKIWTSRLINANDSLGQISYRVFSVHCLVPVLQFLSIRKGVSPSFPENETIIRALEKLLINNVVLPARGSFLSSKSWKKTESEAQSSLSVASLLAPLGEKKNMRIGGTPLLNKADSAIRTISLLFSAAIESLPRVTPKQRSLEDSWLRYLFHQLEQCASSLCAESTSSLQSETYFSTLNLMLYKAVDYKVRLGDSRFEPILDRVLSMSDEEFDAPDTPIYWTLTSLCLEIDPNIFTSSSSIDKSGGGNPNLLPSKHFASLVSRVTNTGWKTSSHSKVNYNFKLSTILLSLAQAFANARDLMTFIFHWQEQLTICQQHRHHLRLSSPDSQLVTNVWEDEKLLSFVGNVIEPSLTTGQIDFMFKKVHANLAPPALMASKDYSASVSSLIILDCIISGLSRESSLDQLAETARSAYFSVSNIVSNMSGWPVEHTWRLWRILATFNNRWSIPQYSKATEQAEQHAIFKAAESMREGMSAETRHVAQDFAKELHAFSFLLSTSCLRVNSPDVSRTKTLPVISVIKTMLDRKQTYFESIGSKMNGSRMFTVQWNGQNETVTSVDILLIGCIARILMLPSVVCCLPPDILRRFFQQLYWSAVSFKEHLGRTGSNSINYLSLWHTLLDSDFLHGDSSATRLFRDLQIRNFLDLIDTQAPKYSVFETEGYKLAFWSVQSAPTAAFDREQRKEIFTTVLRILLSNALPTTRMTVDHICLLVEHVGVSNNSLSLLSAEYKHSAEGPLEGLSTNEAPLLSLARQLDENQDSIPISSISLAMAFTRLAQLTLRNCKSTLAQKGNVKYFESFYDQLIALGTGELQLPHQYAISTLLDACSFFFPRHDSQLPKLLAPKLDKITTLRQQHFEKLCRTLCETDFTKSKIANASARRELIMILESRLPYNNLQVYPNLDEVLNQLAKITALLHNLESLENLKLDSTGLDHLLVRSSMFEVSLGVLNRDLRSAALQAMEVLRTLKSPREKESLLLHLQNAIAETNWEGRTALLKALVKTNDDGHLRVEHLPLLQTVVLAEDGKADVLRPESYTTELGQIFATLCNGILQPTGFRLRMSLIQTMSLLLQKEPRIISQWHIDSTLAAISVVSSQLAPVKEEKTTGMTFMGLCRIFNTILMTHRAQLGGRYHLILPALQGLLRCLFIPYSPPTPNTLPNTQTSTLGEAHAAAYARLLTTITDPTVSAVTRSRSRHPASLNDATQKARSIAGQHLQYLLMDYCKCQLHGTLAPAVKAALNPGLAAVLHVVTPDVLRTINAAMDPSCRSIFKALYDEQRRAGRWHGT